LRNDPSASNSNQDSEKQAMSTQKPETTKNELSEKELSQVSGGFNPQPDPPAVIAKSILDFGIRSAKQTNSL